MRCACELVLSFCVLLWPRCARVFAFVHSFTQTRAHAPHRRTQQSLGLTTSRYASEQFIELFDTDLITLPPELPAWFVEQEALWKAEQEQSAAK